MLCPSLRTIHWVLFVFFGSFFAEVHAFGTPHFRDGPANCPRLSSQAWYKIYVETTQTSQRSEDTLIRRSAKDSDQDLPSEKQNQEDERKIHLEDDIAQRLSISKDRAISALSQPKGDENEEESISAPIDRRKQRQNQRKSQKSKRKKSSSSLLPPPSSEDFDLPYAQQPTPKKNRSPSTSTRRDSYSSLLPPPLGADKNGGGDSSTITNGLSSWEDFLGGPSEGESKERKPKPKKYKPPKPKASKRKDANESNDDADSSLPSIRDLFPPDSDAEALENTALEGVLPVSELFYRSSQSISAQDEDEIEIDTMPEGKPGDDGVDDEELPFSAEQSDQLMIDDGKVKIRRNRVKSLQHDKLVEEMASSAAAASSRKFSNKRKKRGRGRRMVRRGMEMLIGGEPVNADPPQRSVELFYKRPKSEQDWSRVISLNSPAFGPILHTASVGLVTPTEQGLYCEHFVNAAMKWDVCPKDLKGIVKAHTLERMIEDNLKAMKEDKRAPSDFAQIAPFDDFPSTTNNMSATLNPILEKKTEADTSNEDFITAETAQETAKQSSGVGFGKSKKSQKKTKKKKTSNIAETDAVLLQEMGGFGFRFGVTRSELESGHGGAGGAIFRRVIMRGLETALKSELKDHCLFRISSTELKLKEEDTGGTSVDVEYTMEFAVPKGDLSSIDRLAARVGVAFTQGLEDGSIQLAIAAAAKKEKAWPSKIRARVAEEILLEEDEADEPVVYGDAIQPEIDESEESDGDAMFSDEETNDGLEEYDGPFGMPGCSNFAKDDIFLGGGNDGVFNDYSEASVEQSPYKGVLGPILVDAAVARARERHPRVIAIGDVHGCIDELQDLLRRCDYQPGDLVCFLGDLVSKGPDSVSVVQLAREIGSIGVRGNHDFEVVRWHQAIKSGVEPPVVGSEHFHIASCLSKADTKWLYSLPWYISSRDLGALFVHAGFVSGIRLAKQNPRLMMNMRSILPDGTVTSKFFNNWPWARLWDGPQTVLFGHDADRGLQQYEHAIGLDTGCVYGGRLTACILPEKRLVSVSARREYFKYRRKHYD